jgi:midasin
MNPATDVGKKELSPGIRNRFTELFVDELESELDLMTLSAEYLKGMNLPQTIHKGLVKFYLDVRQKANKSLCDISGKKPHYSLRTLCRALKLASTNRYGHPLRSLYESFCLSFLTRLDRPSHPVVIEMVTSSLKSASKNLPSILKQLLPEPTQDGTFHIQVEGYWLRKGPLDCKTDEFYVLTESVHANLKDLSRVVSACSFPVLIQGETSVGKTSLIQYLADTTGNTCVRINNHEHTDIQEYVGSYGADSQSGTLVYQDGVLVEAMRKGFWVILDELNLAPTDVLEALNRLLDDNRELYIPETQETVKAHPMFMLFATQNPPGKF